jgi:hypothetical protein
MSVYKQAFVELKGAVLEEARGLFDDFEAGLAKAADELKPKALIPDLGIVETRASALFTLDSITYIVSTYLDKRGFKICDVQRRAGYENTIASVRLPCRHVGTFALDDQKMMLLSRGSEIVNYVLDVLDGEPSRRCYCVQYEPPVPCTAGECK